jgi:tetratricopeptide (TPR) repeat protein
VTEGDLLSHVFVVLLDGSIGAGLGHFERARRDLEESLVLAEKTSDRYLLSWPLVALANLALYESTEGSLRQGLGQAGLALEVAQEVREELQWTEALDAKARLHLALGQPEEAHEASSQAMKLLASHPWLPKPQNHLYTHALALRALGREAEADDHLRRAYERVMFVADKFADDALRQGWLQNVRVHREILGQWEEIHSPA